MEAAIWETVPALLVQVAVEDELITKRYVNIYLLCEQLLLGANTQKGAFGLPRGLSYPKGIPLWEKKICKLLKTKMGSISKLKRCSKLMPAFELSSALPCVCTRERRDCWLTGFTVPLLAVLEHSHAA